MPLPLPTTVTNTTTGHASLHNQVNTEVNLLGRTTGWRNVSTGGSSLLVNGWTGTVHIRRDNNTIYCRIGALSGTAATADKFMSMPAGFSPIGPSSAPTRASDDSTLWLRIVGGADAASGLHASRSKLMLAGVENVLSWYAAPTSPFPAEAAYPGIGA